MSGNGELLKVQPEMNDIITYNVTMKQIGELKVKYADVPTGLTVKENYEAVRLGIAEIKKLRSSVESRRKELKADALEYGRNVDNAAKEIKEALLEIETPMKLIKTEFDEQKELEKREATRKEEERIDNIQGLIASIKASVESNISSTSDTINTVIDGLKLEKPEKWADEFVDKAKIVISETIAKLEELSAMKRTSEQVDEEAKKREEEDAKRRAEETKNREAEIAKQQKKLAEQQAIIDEQNSKIKEAEEKAKAQEEKAKAQEEKAKQVKLAEERRMAQELLAKEKAESDRKEEEKRKAEQKIKEKEAREQDEQRTDEMVNLAKKYTKTVADAKLLISNIKEGCYKYIKWTC